MLYCMLNIAQCPCSCMALQAVGAVPGQAFPFFKPNWSKMEEYGQEMGVEEVSFPTATVLANHNDSVEDCCCCAVAAAPELKPAHRWWASCRRGGRTRTSGRRSLSR